MCSFCNVGLHFILSNLAQYIDNYSTMGIIWRMSKPPVKPLEWVASSKGIETAKQDVGLIRDRLKFAQKHSEGVTK